MEKELVLGLLGRTSLQPLTKVQVNSLEAPQCFQVLETLEVLEAAEVREVLELHSDLAPAQVVPVVFGVGDKQNCRRAMLFIATAIISKLATEYVLDSTPTYCKCICTITIASDLLL